MRLFIFLPILVAAGCGPGMMRATGGDGGGALGDDLGPGRRDLASVPPDMAYGGAFYKFVTDRINFPQIGTDFGFSPNGDNFPHNQFAKLVIALFQKNVLLQPAENVGVTIDGDGLLLLSLGTRDPNLISDREPFVNLYVADLMKAPDLTGGGTFAPHPNFPKGTLGGELTAGTFVGADPSRLGAAPTAPLRLSLGATSRVTLPLVGAHITFQTGASGLMKGELHGALRKEDVDSVLVPSLAANLTLIAQRPDCGNDAECTNVRALFDTGPKDGRVDNLEVKTSPWIAPSLAPDVDLFDAAGKWSPNPKNSDPESWSLGIGFTARKAMFVEK